jgi:probable HAF family extracellular repeat protein
MKFRTWSLVVAATLVAVLAGPTRMAAQGSAKQHHPHQYHHYQLVDVGTFGGPVSGLQNPNLPRAGVLNNRGTLVGFANTPGSDYPYCGFGNCYAGDAFQLRDGVTTDLGRLSGGFDSQVNWISASGAMTGVGDNGQPDPLAGFLITQIHGLFWDHGTMTDLGTLPGGYNSFSMGVNNRGEVVGSAQNTVPDPNSMQFPYGTQTRAFYWKDGTMQDIGTLADGTNAIAALINERGQVTGWSYTNSTPSAICAGFPFFFPLTTSSFIWDQHHGMHDIGGLGGTCTIAQDFNNRGQIVGDSALMGDTLLHPFVWDSATGMTDLGTASGNYGEARAINEHGDVVGQVCDAAYSSCPAALWQKAGGKWRMTNLGTIVTGGCAKSTSVNASAQVVGTDWCAGLFGLPFLSEDGGPVVDLNTLVPPSSGIQLVEGVQINDRGEIAAQGPDANGNNHAVLLIPCDENHLGVEGCDYSMVDAPAAVAQTTPAVHNESSPTLPLTMRRMNRHRMSGLGALRPE